jgi:GNAT superfamily N-acetyltransferase
MVQIEDPVTTLVRLLDTNIQVVKDDGSLADICVTTEWYDRELLKNVDGQVTVGLDHSEDQKLGFSATSRRRVGYARVKIWVVDKPGSAGKQIRNKLRQEVNRVVREKRTKPNQTNYNYVGVGAESATHRAYYAESASELAPDAQEWTEFSAADYEKLAHFHYRDSRVFAYHKIFVMKRGDETVGAIVYGSPPLAVTGRRKAIGKPLTIQEINRDIIRISRVVIHPKYRTIGLGAKIVAETLPLAGKPYVETIAVMAKYNPFFEKAGMTKIAETTPNPQILKVVDKLRAFNFNPVFLTSEKANLNKLQSMTEKEVDRVRAVIKEVTGIYRKRVAGTKQAFLNKQEYGAIVDAADTTKLAKMIRILGFLTQTKVYLFWKDR